jgi:sec-independent protein translocase protein TatC
MKNETIEEKPLSFLGHLREFRNRLMWSAIFFIVMIPVAYFSTNYLFKILIAIAPPNIDLIYTEMTEMLGVFIKVNLLIALVYSLPFITYQLIMFIRPALTKNERRWLYILLPSIVLLFVVGALFAYKILLPPALRFLLSFNTEVAKPMIKIGNYINLVMSLLFWIGICFEIPLVLFFLTKIGIVQTKWLSKFRKFAYIIAFILGAIITPTLDPVNQSLVAVPIILLYELGILLSRLARRKRPSTV